MRLAAPAMVGVVTACTLSVAPPAFDVEAVRRTFAAECAAGTTDRDVCGFVNLPRLRAEDGTTLIVRTKLGPTGQQDLALAICTAFAGAGEGLGYTDIRVLDDFFADAASCMVQQE